MNKTFLAVGIGSLLFGLSLEASGERLLRIPTAIMVGPSEAKGELIMRADDPQKQLNSLEWGVDEKLEVESFNARGAFPEDDYSAFNLQLNVVPLLPGIAPALAIGARDLFSRSDRGVGFYAVFSDVIPTDEDALGGRDVVFHFGLGSRSIKGLFLGFELPLASKLTFIAEHTGREANLAFEWQPVPPLQLRAYLLDGHPCLGVSGRMRF